jgi:GlpG protein
VPRGPVVGRGKDAALRQIGTLPSTVHPGVFGDYLLSQGVTSRAIESKDGWAIWVHNEDHVPQAREALAAYQQNPNDPRFASATDAARAVRREEERLNRQYRKNVREMSGTWDRVDFRRRPLTVLLVVVCVAVFVAQQLSPWADYWLLDRLAFFPIDATRGPADMTRGLDAIHRGEVWRLITPIFLHGNLIHLLFNMWLTLLEGTIIETRRGTRTLAVLVLLSAVTSNIGQYIYILNFYPVLVPWVGISGVGYALFGYLWMKGRNQPEEGMILDPRSVRIMLFWLLLGFVPVLPFQMANGAHVVGLIVGVLFGLARF